MAVEHTKSSDARHLSPLPIATTLWAQEPHGTVCYIRVCCQRDWCFGVSHSELSYALWYSGAGLTLGSWMVVEEHQVSPPPPIVHTFHLSRYFLHIFLFTELLPSLKKHSMLFTFWGPMGLIFYLGYWRIYLCLFSPHQCRRLVRACHRPCLKSVRWLCPLPRQHWRLPLYLSPVAYLHQQQSRLLQARWDAEKDVLMKARANLGKN